MAVKKYTLLKRIIRRMPLSLFALVVGVLVGGTAWLVIDRVQTAALSDIFEEALQDQLDQQARESLLRFDQHRQSYVYLARLLAYHRRMATYLDPIIWPEFWGDFRAYREMRPLWLPKDQFWPGEAPPSHFILADVQGALREVYSVQGDPLPEALTSDPAAYLTASRQRAFLTTLRGQPFLVVSEPVEDSASHPMGSLVMLVPLDSKFLVASQQAVPSTQSIVAILDPETQRILSSSAPKLVGLGDSVDSLRKAYVVTAQSFFDYGDSDLNMLYATLVRRDGFTTTSEAVLEQERRQRAMGTAGIIVVFVLLFVLVSGRINRVMKRLQEFSHKALGQKTFAGALPGNRLLLLEDRIREVIELVLRIRDETRSRHESEMQQIESLRVAVMEASLDGIATIDADGVVIDFNPTAQKLFGKTRVQAAGQKLADLIFAPDSAEQFSHLLLACSRARVRQAGVYRHELTALGQEGQALSVDVTIKPVLLQDELLYTVYMRDIAEQKQREAEIRSLAAFPEESPSPILRVNNRGVVTYANAPSLDLLDYWACRRLQTLPLYWVKQVQEVLTSGEYREREIVTGNGVFSLLLTPVLDEGYVNIYARDITDQRHAEDALRQRQNELVHVARLSTMGEMSTGIAHELNQPLSAIANYSNGCIRRLRMGTDNKQDMLSALGQIAAQATRAADIIKRLRSLVTRQHMVRSVRDLNELIDEVCDLFAYDLRKHAVVLFKTRHPQPLWVKVDSVQIQQALLNLMRNAVDSMQDNPASDRRLVIACGECQGMGYASVSDNGNGISKQNMVQLFAPFFTTKMSGMGMGLAITQTIVDDHQGRIRADSTPGKGSCFTLELPIEYKARERLVS